MTAQLIPASRLPYIYKMPELGTYQTMDEIKEAHPLWFSEDTMAFFDSIVMPNVYSGCVFVSSEKFNYETPRRYTVRIALNKDEYVCPVDGVWRNKGRSIQTDQLFQAWHTADRAHKRAKWLGEQLTNLWYFWSVQKDRPLDNLFFELAKRCGLEMVTELHGDEEWHRMRFGYDPSIQAESQQIGGDTWIIGKDGAQLIGGDE